MLKVARTEATAMNTYRIFKLTFLSTDSVMQRSATNDMLGPIATWTNAETKTYQ